MLTGSQIRMARALLRLDQAQLAELAGVSTPTVIRLERADGPVSANTRTVAALVGAIEQAGAQLIQEDATGGPGVRLLKS